MALHLLIFYSTLEYFFLWELYWPADWIFIIIGFQFGRISNVLPKEMKAKFSEATYFPVCFMPFPLQYYYRDNWVEQTILAKKKGKYIELLFVDGLPDLYFMNFVQSSGVFKNNIDIYSATIDFGLSYDGERGGIWGKNASIIVHKIFRMTG